MQHLVLFSEIDEAHVEQTIHDLESRQLISKLQKESIDPYKIVSFFHTVLGQRMLNARDRVRREIPFTFGIPASMEQTLSQESTESQDKIIVQGIIDCFFEDEQGLVIIDFKTDSLKNASLAQLVEKYRVQIEMYARALTEIIRKPVTEKYLYFFDSNEFVDVDSFFRYD
jgi:ATP-dependent helicase/nuclease subunit A